MAGVGLNRRAPQFQLVILAPLSEEVRRLSRVFLVGLGEPPGHGCTWPRRLPGSWDRRTDPSGKRTTLMKASIGTAKDIT